MSFLRFLVAVVLSCFSTAVMSYITMAIPIGPWIETTLVLCGLIIFAIFSRSSSTESRIKNLGLTTAAGGIGGILATGIGFSFPTLYFVDCTTFNSWLSMPLYFSCVVSALALAAGSFGLVVADLFEERLIVKQQMPFAIGELVYKMIAVQDQAKKAISLAIGFISTTLLLYTQNCTSFIAQQFTVFNKLSFSIFMVPQLIIRTDFVPMFLAVGFVTGHVIAIPLIVGFLSKLAVLDPLYFIYTNSNTAIYQFFATYVGPVITKITGYHAATKISSEEFSIAFCSGMIVYGVLLSFIDLPKTMRSACKNLMSAKRESGTEKSFMCYLKGLPWIQISFTLIMNIAFLTYFKFSILSQLYLLVFTFIWTYQVLIIAGKISMAPLGRFATFVMVPGMFLFGFNMIQVTFVATFVEIAVGVASDVLFGRKMAHLGSIDRRSILSYQWLGLIVSALVVGIICWLLIFHFKIGPTGELPVNKAYTRALLINIKSFDVFALLMGTIFGYLLKFTKVNPALVLGGILLPAQYSLLLVLGGLLTYLCKDKEDYYPLWSGVFAANSLWMIIKTIFKNICFF